MPTILLFNPGTVELSASTLRFSKYKVLSFNPGDVDVDADTIRLDPQRSLSFRSGDCSVTSPGISLRLRDQKLSFVPPEIVITSPGLAMGPRPRGVFPDLRPTRRRFIPAAFARTQARSEAGFTSHRLWASAASGGRLELSFENVPNVQAEAILQLHDTAKGGFLPLSLPADVFAGLDDELRSLMAEPGEELEWHFAEPPKVQCVMAGVNTVNVSFVARRVPKYNTLAPGNVTACEVVYDAEEGEAAIVPVDPEVVCGDDFKPEVCLGDGASVNFSNETEYWFALHGMSPNYGDRFGRTKGGAEWSGGGKTLCCCFDTEGNTYSVLCSILDHELDYDDTVYISFVKLSPKGKQLWDITYRGYTGGGTQASDGGIRFGGIFDFSATHIITAYWLPFQPDTPQYVLLIPKDGNPTDLRFYSFPDVEYATLQVFEYGTSFLLLARDRPSLVPSGPNLTLINVRADLTLDPEWSTTFNDTSGLITREGLNHMRVSRYNKDIIIGQWQRYFCVDRNGVFKWSRILFVDRFGFVNPFRVFAGGTCFDTDNEGNLYVGYTFDNTVGFTTPFLIKVDKDGNFVKAVSYVEETSSYSFLYFIQFLEPGRIAFVGEGSYGGQVYCVKVVLMTTDLVYIKTIVFASAEADYLQHLCFMDNVSNLYCLDFYAPTQELLIGFYVGRGRSRFSQVSFNGIPANGGIVKVPIDAEQLTGWFKHPDIRSDKPMVAMPRVGYLTNIPNGNYSAPTPTSFVFPNSYIYNFEEWSEYDAARYLKLWEEEANQPEKEFWQETDNPAVWFFDPTTPVIGVYWDTDSIGLAQIGPDSDPFRLPSSSDVTNTLPIQLVARQNPTPNVDGNLPICLVAYWRGQPETAVSDKDIVCQLDINTGSFNLVDSKTGTVFSGDPIYAARSDHRGTMYGLQGRITGRHPRFNLRTATEVTIEFDLFIDAFRTTSVQQVLCQVGNLVLVVDNVNTIEAYMTSSNPSNLWTYLTALNSNAKVPTNRWLTISLSIINNEGLLRVSGEFDVFQHSGDGRVTGFDAGQTLLSQSGYYAHGEQITVGGSHEPVLNYTDFNLGFIGKFRVTAKSLYHQVGPLPVFGSFLPVTRSEQTLLDQFLASVTTRVPTPVPTPQDVASVLTFEGPSGGTNFVDLGEATWTSFGGERDNSFGDGALDCRNGGILSTDFPNLIEPPYFIEFEYLHRYKPISALTFDQINGYQMTLMALYLGESRIIRIVVPMTLIGENVSFSRLAVLFCDGVVTTTSLVYSAHSLPYSLGARHHFALVVDADFTIRVYIDGICFAPDKQLTFKPSKFEYLSCTRNMHLMLGNDYRRYGGSINWTESFNGFIFSFRAGRGALYNENFIPPTSITNVIPSYTEPAYVEDVKDYEFSDVLAICQTNNAPGSKTISNEVNSTPVPIYFRMAEAMTVLSLATDAFRWLGSSGSLGWIITSEIGLKPSDPFTCEFFWQLDSAPTGARVILSIDPTLSILVNNSSQIYLQTNSSSGVEQPQQITTPSSITYGLTYHIALVKYSDRQVALYAAGTRRGIIDTTDHWLSQVRFMFNGATTDAGAFSSRYGAIRISKYPVYSGTVVDVPSSNDGFSLSSV